MKQTKFLIVATLFFIKSSIAVTLPLSNASHTVSATGNGEVMIPQTQAIISLTISETANTPNKAQEKTKDKANSAIKAIRSQNPLSIETTSISVSPNWSYASKEAKISGYTANYTILVKSAITAAGTIIDTALKSGVSIINDPQLIASESERNIAQKQAIKLATLDAKEHATAALEALGLHVSSIAQVEVITENNRPIPLMYNAMLKSATSENQATPIIAGKESVKATVNLSLAY